MDEINDAQMICFRRFMLTDLRAPLWDAFEDISSRIDDDFESLERDERIFESCPRHVLGFASFISANIHVCMKNAPAITGVEA